MRKANPSFRSSSLSEPLAKRPIRICRTSVSLSEPQSLFPTSKSAGSNLTKCRKTPWGSLSARRLIKPCVDHRPARIWPRIEGYASLLNYIVPTLSIGDHRSEQLNDTNIDISTRTQHLESNDHRRYNDQDIDYLGSSGYRSSVKANIDRRVRQGKNIGSYRHQDWSVD